MTPHRFPLTVYYEDTDMAGVVYYANYLRYIERARSTIVEDMGLDQNAMREQGIVFVVTRVEADYITPARMGDRLEVVTSHQAASRCVGPLTRRCSETGRCCSVRMLSPSP